MRTILAKVLIIEDDVFTRTALTAALNMKSIRVTGAVSSAAQSLTLQRTQPAEVAIIDLDLGPGPNGIDIALGLRRISPAIGIIILTSYSDPRIAASTVAPLPQGSRYFVKSKFTEINSLITAIIQCKNRPLQKIKAPIGEITPLTDLQIEVLRNLAQGMTTAKIAHERGVSEKTIEKSFSRIQEILEIDKNSGENIRILLSRAFSNLAGKKLPGD